MFAYLIDKGIMKQHGYEDKGQQYDIDKKEAIATAHKYIENGPNSSFAIVVKTNIPDNESICSQYGKNIYTASSIVYSAVKINGKIITDFLNKSINLEEIENDQFQESELEL